MALFKPSMAMLEAEHDDVEMVGEISPLVRNSNRGASRLLFTEEEVETKQELANTEPVGRFKNKVWLYAGVILITVGLVLGTISLLI